MKPTLAFDSLSLFNSDSTNTTTTLTPTTLKTITQIFESDDCLKNLQQFDQGGFVPPSPSPPLATGNTNNSRPQSGKTYFNLTGGTTTIVAHKFEPPTTISIPKLDDGDDFSSNFSEESDEDYRPQPKMLKRFKSSSNKLPAKNRSGTAAGNKRKGNRKDDYDGLPIEEQSRLKQKREKNKEAAARCRQRKVDQINTLSKEVQMWMGKKSNLEKEIQELRVQKEELEYILQAHRAVCQLNGEQHQFEATQDVKTEEDELDDNYDYLLQPTQPTQAKRARPITLAFAQPVSQTLSSGFSFENFLTPSSGMTPMSGVVTQPIETLNTPIIHSTSFNTPGECINLLSL